jgi:cell division septum initiation protein DivIVA
VTWKRRLLAVAALATVSSCATARAAGLPGGDPLQRLRAEESARTVQSAPSRRAGIVWVALGSGALLLVVISAVQTKRPPHLAQVGAQTPEGGAHMRRRFNEREETGGEQVEAPAAEAPEAGDGGFAELGQHVATVLATAREAAEKIQGDAQREATQVIERAKAEAEQTLAQAREKAAELEAETAEKRSAAFAAAEDVRTRADAYAEKKQQQADEATAEAIARAERQARERARAAEERQQVLDSHVERTEERLRKLVTGLRELAGRLDVLVGSDALVELVEPVRESEAPQPAGLDDELQRQVAQPAQVETGSNGQEA